MLTSVATASAKVAAAEIQAEATSAIAPQGFTSPPTAGSASITTSASRRACAPTVAASTWTGHSSANVTTASRSPIPACHASTWTSVWRILWFVSAVVAGTRRVATSASVNQVQSN